MILTFFAIFENGHMAIDWLYFYEFNLKKSANFAACTHGARAAKFSFFKKNHRDLENEYFFLKLAWTFLSLTSKTNFQK